MRLRGDRLGRFRVPDDDVGVGAHGDTALAGIDVEDLRRIRGRDCDELVHRQAPCTDAVVPEHLHAVFDASRAVRDLAEIVLAHGLLVGTETAMIRGRRLQVAGLQALPEGPLVILRAERRAHDVRRSGIEILVSVHGIVDKQVACEHLTEHALSFVAGARYGLE